MTQLVFKFGTWRKIRSSHSFIHNTNRLLREGKGEGKSNSSLFVITISESEEQANNGLTVEIQTANAGTYNDYQENGGGGGG